MSDPRTQEHCAQCGNVGPKDWLTRVHCGHRLCPSCCGSTTHSCLGARTQEHEAAAEKLAREIVRALVFVPDRKDGEPRVVLPPITALIAAALADAVRVAREDSDKAKRLLTILWETHEECEGGHDHGEGRAACIDCAVSDYLNARVGDAAATAKPEKRFPIIVGIREPAITIPWSVAERAYVDYVQRFGAQQTLERIAESGGFCAAEMDELLPGWRGEGDATPGPEPFHPAPCFARAVDIIDSAPERSPDPALLEAIKGSLKWATPPKKGRDASGVYSCRVCRKEFEEAGSRRICGKCRSLYPKAQEIIRQYQSPPSEER